MTGQPIRCCVCRGFAVMIVWAPRVGYSKPSCLTCWPRIDIPKDAYNNPVHGQLMQL